MSYHSSLLLWTIFLHLPTASSALLTQAWPPWASPMGGGLMPYPWTASSEYQRNWRSIYEDWAEFIVAVAAAAW